MPPCASPPHLLCYFLSRALLSVDMPSLLTSQALVLATTMLVSSTVIFLALSMPKITHFSKKQDPAQAPCQNLRSCLCPGRNKREGKKKKKKKRVHFSEDVKYTKGEGVKFRKEKENGWIGSREKFNTRMDGACRYEIPGVQGMPANRIALYNQILRNRVHRIEYSH